VSVPVWTDSVSVFANSSLSTLQPITNNSNLDITEAWRQSISTYIDKNTKVVKSVFGILLSEKKLATKVLSNTHDITL